MSWRARWWLGSKEPPDATVRFDLERNRKRCRIRPKRQRETGGPGSGVDEEGEV